MARCEKEGEFAATITAIDAIQSRFKPGQGEIRIEFATGEETGKVYLSMGLDYIQAGNNQGRKEVEVTQEILQNFGATLMDITSIKKLVGKHVSIYGKRNAKGYVNFYLNTNKPEEVMSDQEYNAYIQSLFGSAPAQTQAPVQQAQPVNSVPQDLQPVNQQPPAANGNLFAEPTPQSTPF